MSSEIEIYYKDELLDTMDESGAKTILTAGKYCEDNIGILYTRPSVANVLIFGFKYVNNMFVPDIPSNDIKEAYENEIPIIAVIDDANLFLAYTYSPLREGLEYKIGYSYGSGGLKVDSYVYWNNQVEITYSVEYIPAPEEE